MLRRLHCDIAEDVSKPQLRQFTNRVWQPIDTDSEGLTSGADSNTSASTPIRCRLNARAKPPIPPTAIKILICISSGRYFQTKRCIFSTRRE